MHNRVGVRAKFPGGLLPALLFVALAIPGHAATFGLGTLIEVGLSGSSLNGAVLAAGDNGSASSIAGSVSSFQNNQGRWFEVIYQKPTNTLQVRLYNGTTSASTFSSVNYSPTGGASVGANATWTIPASAFFVTASGRPVLGSSITISSLTLSGLSGGLNIISPMQQTTLSASRGVLGGAVTSIESGDVVFQGDSNGSWMLSGLMTLNGIIAGPVGATGADLAFGFSGSANSTVPETSSLPLVGTGLAALIIFRRRKASAAEKALRL